MSSFCFKITKMHLNIVRRYISRITDLKNILVVNMVCLCVNLFLIVMQVEKGIWPDESYFPQSLTTRDQSLILKTLEVMTELCDRNNVTYFLYAGSMLGSYRHHDIIPWDDDCDIMFNASQKSRVKEILESVHGYKLYSQAESEFDEYGTWKFYSVHSKSFIHRPFSWPYIDMFFFRENRTHIWDEIPKYGEAFTKRKEWIFPLTKRPFGTMDVLAPCDMEKAIEGVFDSEYCQSPAFNHMVEMPALSFNKRLIPCKRLERRFPFVYHQKLEDGSYNESLVLSGWTLRSRKVPRCDPR